MQRDTITQLIALLVLVASLTVSGGLAVELTASGGRNKLSYADTAEEGQPPQVAAGIAMGAFRGLFVNILWIRANALKEDGRFYEAIDLAKAITTLQPRFPQVWVFHAWNMAYNISVSTQTPEERWQWVTAGIRLLRDRGVPANPNDLLLHKELAWIFLHKIGGYLDDANLYYKRRLAEEWTEVLGPPPAPDPLDRDRAHATKKYVDWLRPIADAPSSPREVVAAEPSVRTLLERLKNEVGIEPDYNLVYAYAHFNAIANSGSRSLDEFRMNPQEKALLAAVSDPEMAKAWAALLAFLRQRILVDVYKMEPARMIRYTETYGPIDWRHHAAHGLYWSQRGVENALTRVNNENKRDFDFINSGRIVVQSLQELWRSGDLTFDFLAYVRNPNNPAPFYRASPNIHFIDSYGEHLDKFVKLSWADRKDRVYSMYSAGYENFRKDAIRFLYRRGEKERARKMKEDLAHWHGQNLNATDERTALFSMDLDDFVLKELEDQLTRPSVAREEVVGSIQGAFIQGLLAGDMDLFREQMQYAKMAHTYFFSRQGHKNALDPNEMRMAQMDPDFNMVAGQEFAALVSILDLDDAETVYDAAPNTIRVFGYDVLVQRYREGLDAAMKQTGGRTFDQRFPEPPGMAQHRAAMLEYEKKRGSMPGVELK